MLPYLINVPALVDPQNPSKIHGIPGYGVMMVVAFATAYALVNGRIRRFGMSADQLIPLFIASAVGGILGSRVLFFIGVDGLVQTLLHPGKIFSFASGGLAVYGGVLGGALAVLSWIWAMKLPAWKLADVIGPSVVVAMGIGRIGCFFAGCCHGAVVDMGPGAWSMPLLHGAVWVSQSFPFFALEYHDHDAVTRIFDQPLYPTQVWSAASSLIIGFGSIFLLNFRRFDGMVIAFVLATEPLSRAFSELFRADQRGYFWSWEVSQVPSWLPVGLQQAGDRVAAADGHVIGITTSQGIGVIFFVVGMLIVALRWRAGVAPEVEVEDEA
jgi:phosphatidylglycerol:prolipoprotein diacylglycerol transferase